MTLFRTIALAGALALIAPLAHASAHSEVRVDRSEDSEHNLVYQLVNSGTRAIVARVEHRKRCNSLSGEREPQKRDYLVRPGRPIRLRKVWSESSCEHRYTIIEAAYYVQNR